MATSLPRWLLPTGILLALLALACHGSLRSDPPPVDAVPPPPVIYADSGSGPWTAARKRAARRGCAARFADPVTRRRCLAAIPNDGDWGAMAR